MEGTKLLDPCGEPIVLRGANNLIIYPDCTGESTLPGQKVGADGFGVKWLGLLVPPLDGDYTFHLASDDAAEVWLDGLLVWDNWGRYSKYPQPEASFRLRNLVGGRPYELEVRYAEVDGPARVRLEWWHRAIERAVIPAEQLYPPLRN